MSTAKISNQSKAPICAAFVEKLRAVFGEDQVIVRWIGEGEVTLGSKDEGPYVQVTQIHDAA